LAPAFGIAGQSPSPDGGDDRQSGFPQRQKARRDAGAFATGPRIAFAGGPDCSDHQRIWDTLDKAHAQHPGMVLLHRAGPEGAERVAASWAENRKVPQVAFKPNWTRDKNAAPFKRRLSL
jgi:hypothetical protein